MTTKRNENNIEREAQGILTFLASSPAYGSTTCTRGVLRALLLKTDGRMMACGSLYDIKSKHVGAGIYRVSLADWRKG